MNDNPDQGQAGNPGEESPSRNPRMSSFPSGTNVEAQLEAELQGQDFDTMLEESLHEKEPDEPAADDATPPQLEGHRAAQAEAPEPKHHEFRRGRIAAIRGDDVFVDLVGETGKLQGVVPGSQFERSPRIGSIMDFVVDHVDEAQGLMFLSREGAISRATWDHMTKGAAVEARCVATNKGGLELEIIGGIRAFMPASQVDLHHVGELEPFIGQKLEALVQDVDRKSKKVVLSRRAFLEQRKEAAKAKLFSELAVGQTVQGTVVNVVDYGAFVDVGGVDGLLHVSDMSHARVDKPGDVVSKGQKLDLKVLKMDPDKGRISLGLKQVQPDPWDRIGATVEVGQQVTGKVIRTAQFGAFVELEPGVDGLLPMSELSWKRVHKAEEVVKVGEQVRAAVLNIDPAKKRLTLSLKQTTGDPWVGAEHKYGDGQKHEGRVIGTTDFGAFVELEPGLEGLVHISELADRRVDAVTDIVNVGDVKPFRVLEVDEENRKIRLSLKPAPQGQREADEAAIADAQLAAQKAGKGGKGAGKAQRKKRGNLRGGADLGGIGLGNLSLDDLG